MSRWLVWAALAAFAAGSSASLFAQSTTAPPLPAWPDQASVYLTMNEKPESATGVPDAGPAAAPTVRTNTMAPPVAVTTLSPATVDETRRLAPPRAGILAAKPIAQEGVASSANEPSRGFGLPDAMALRVASALAIVLGLFLLFAWLMRRGARGVGATLPSEVVSVLGRVPLAARQFADLLRVGNKLVLVTSTSAGPATLTEVTDPAEVDRIVGLCQQQDPHSTTKAFEQVFRQLARDPGPNDYLDHSALPPTFSPSIKALRMPRGEAPRV